MVTAILTSIASAEPQRSHEQIKVLDNGLAGDRYATGKGFYSGVEEWDAHVTLIGKEAFDKLAAEHGVEIDAAELRRNLVTQGIDLNSLIDRRFKIGESVILYGRRPWPPCGHIVKLTGKREIFKYLAKHCGIGADVVVGGTIKLGDAIVLIDE